jgi:hypothetical protein
MQLPIFYIVFTFYIAYIILYWIVAISNGVSYLWHMVHTRASEDVVLDITRDLQVVGVVMGRPREAIHRPSSTMCTCQHQAVAGDPEQAHECAHVE